MTKYKCNCCKKEYNKNQVVIECNCCYLNGICKELKKVLEEYLIKRKDISSVENEPTTEDKIKKEVDKDYEK